MLRIAASRFAAGDDENDEAGLKADSGESDWGGVYDGGSRIWLMSARMGLGIVGRGNEDVDVGADSNA